jgi:hypothetical protein
MFLRHLRSSVSSLCCEHLLEEMAVIVAGCDCSKHHRPIRSCCRRNIVRPSVERGVSQQDKSNCLLGIGVDAEFPTEAKTYIW